MLLHSGMMGEPYGLINTSQWPNSQVPLETFNVYAHVVNNIADVTCELSYMNDTSELMESIFVFPIEGSASVYELVAVIGKKRLVATCRERNEASYAIINNFIHIFNLSVRLVVEMIS